MTDYNWKSCADPANAARLRELLEVGRKIIVETSHGAEYFTRHDLVYVDEERMAEMDLWLSFLDPDEPAQMRARIAELQAENQRLTEIAEYNNEHLANYRKQLNDRDERKEIYD